jgi:hypothetical protein
MIIGLVFMIAMSSLAFAGKQYDEPREYQKDGNKSLKTIKYKTYLDECGACHFAFQPELLPARSWEKMMNNLDDHFGTDASLDEETRADISAFLRWDSAEKSSAKRAIKFLKSIPANQSPLRITETRYFIDKHDEITPDVYKRKAIGSAANCEKCHTTANKGNYDDEFVKVPRR